MYEIERLDAAGAEAAVPELVALLRDAVDGGASVGFLPPLVEEEAHDYWRKVLGDLRAGTRRLLVVRLNGAIAGSVQLALAAFPNGRHRAEVAKLLVLRAERRQGIGRALLAAVEYEARAAGRRLLVLDTRRGDPAEALYRSHGYVKAGVIPRYVLGPNGTFDDTVVYYHWLNGQQATAS